MCASCPLSCVSSFSILCVFLVRSSYDQLAPLEPNTAPSGIFRCFSRPQLKAARFKATALHVLCVHEQRFHLAVSVPCLCFFFPASRSLWSECEFCLLLVTSSFLILDVADTRATGLSVCVVPVVKRVLPMNLFPFPCLITKHTTEIWCFL